MTALTRTRAAPLVWAACAAIGAYQRWLSPLKGFSCPMRVRRGRPSCSHYAKRVIRRYGLLAGAHLTRRRLARCGVVASQPLDYQPTEPRNAEDEKARRRREPCCQRRSCDDRDACWCGAEAADCGCDLFT